MRIFKTVGFLVLTLVLVASLAIYTYLHWVVPNQSGVYSVPELSDTVEVRYDHFGVPHIYAQNDTDAYFALGFAVARDRLFQMELLRRVGAGRLSEVFGKDLVSTDAFFRTLGIDKQARFHAAAFSTQLNGEWQRRARAYMDGVNHYMATGPLPAEFTLLGIAAEPFTAVDMYLVSGYMALSFSEALKVDPVIQRISQIGSDYIKKVCPECDSDSTTSLLPIDKSKQAAFLSINRFMEQTLQSLPVQIWTGSNAWVVAPSRSETGSVLFANDTHIGYQQPSVWFEAHLDFEGHNLYGKYIAGMPFPLVAHNGSVACGVTMLENDDVQLYLEKDSVGKGYVYKDNLKPYYSRSETIRVKDGTDTTIVVRETVHGPVISDVVELVDSLGLGPVSMWWTYLQLPVTAFEISHGMAYAKNLDEFKISASKLNAPGLNIAYGDTAGNIAVFAAAKLPVYPSNGTTKMIVDGTSGEFDVTSYFPFETNPHRINPTSGFVYSANEALDTNSNRFPGYYPPFDRANRLAKILAADSSVSISDMCAWMMDDVSDSHRSSANLIHEVIAPVLAKSRNTDELFGLFVLGNWDGSHGLDDPAPSVYYLTLAGITERMMQDELGDKAFEAFRNTHQMKWSYPALLSDEKSPWWDDVGTTKKVERRDEIMVSAFRDAIAFLRSRFDGRSQWKWANLHTVEHGHALGAASPLNLLFNVGPYSVRGGLETINNMSFHIHSDTVFHVKYGPAMRTIVDLGSPASAISVLPTGQSGHVMSNHYDDQAKLHANGLFRPMLTDRIQIKDQSRGVLLLVPEIR